MRVCEFTALKVNVGVCLCLRVCVCVIVCVCVSSITVFSWTNDHSTLRCLLIPSAVSLTNTPRLLIFTVNVFVVTEINQTLRPNVLL